jgi:hypothetical protein
MFDANEVVEILTAAGVDVPPAGAPGPNAATICHKIAWDGFVQKIAMELACQAFTVAAVKQMTDGQRAVLRKRLDLGVAAPAPRLDVRWHVVIPVMPGQPVAIVGRLYGEPDAEGKPTIREDTRYCGSPEGAHRLIWKGSRPGPDVIAEYEAFYKPVPQLDSAYYLAANSQLKPDKPVIGLPEDFRK